MPAMRFPSLAEAHRGHGPRLSQIGTDQRDGSVDAGLALFGGSGRLRELLAQVAFQDFRHQPVHRAAHGGELLQHGRAVGAFLKRALQRIQLPADAAHAGERLLLVGGGMGHAGGYRIVGGSIAEPIPQMKSRAPVNGRP